MKEHPILFSGPMVRAILDGRKTQTRRVIKKQPNGSITQCYHCPDGRWNWCFSSGVGASDPWPCPYGVPGDRLWVREAWKALRVEVPRKRPVVSVQYKASLDVRQAVWFEDDLLPRDRQLTGRWKPSIHMPRWASRILLEVKRVWVERVQDISEEDARVEGISCHDEQVGKHFNLQTVYAAFPDKRGGFASAREAFECLWDSINTKRGFGWDSNPWVWCVEFERVANETDTP